MQPTTQPVPAGGPGPDTEDDTPDTGATEADGGQDMPNVTPQEQQLYDKVVTQIRHTIFDPHSLPAVITKLAKGGQSNAAGAIGSTAAMLLMSVKQMAAQQKPPTDIPADVLYAASKEVIGDLLDLAVASHIVPEAQKQQVASASLFEGLKVWGKSMQQGGQITPQLQQDAQQQLAAKGIKQNAPQQGAAPAAPPTAPPGPAGPPPVGIANQGVAAPQGTR